MIVDDDKSHMVYEDNGDGTMTFTCMVKELGIPQTTMVVDLPFEEMARGIMAAIDENTNLTDIGRDIVDRGVIIPNSLEE